LTEAGRQYVILLHKFIKQVGGEGGREGGKEGGRKGGREGRSEAGREGGPEEGRRIKTLTSGRGRRKRKS
jgi:hypothetical protein